MADTLFTAGTIVASSWLNDVDKSVYAVLSAVAGTNTITANGPLPVTSYTRGLRFFFTPAATNTGPVTLNINGLGAKNVTRQGAVPLGAGEIVQSSTVVVFYDGAQFQLLAPYQGPLLGIDTYVTTAGSTTAYTVTFPDQFSLVSGRAVKVLFNAANTSTAPTLNVNGTGAIAIKLLDFNGTKFDPSIGSFGANMSATARYDGTNWVVSVEYPSGRLINIQTITTSGNYTPTPGTTSILAYICGGGGAGGGAAATGVGARAAGSGGNAGALCIHRATSGFSGAAIVVGGGGAGVSGAGGNAGVASTFLGVSATGGAGGGTGGPAGGAEATISSATVAGTGANISNGATVSGHVGLMMVSTVVGGAGGPSFLGGGGGATAAGGGLSGLSRGSGGGGAAAAPSSGAQTGGTGQAGVVIIHEYS